MIILFKISQFKLKTLNSYTLTNCNIYTMRVTL